MTDRERFVRQMHIRSVDRCFNREFGYWQELFTDWPLFRENAIRSPEDWKRVKAERFRLDESARRLDVERVRRLLPAHEGIPLGVYIGSLVGLIRQMLTLEGFVYACADYPEMVEDMAESCCLLTKNALDQLLPHVPADIVNCYENICRRNGPVVPMGFFRDVLVPRYKRLHRRT